LQVSQVARGETLERDGEPAHQVYREFAGYVGGLPLVAFNVAYDLDELLQPEWKRLGIGAIGRRVLRPAAGAAAA